MKAQQTKRRSKISMDEVKSLAVIDLGNGEIKLKYRKPGASFWYQAKFQSNVATVSKCFPSCFKVDGKTYLAGEDANRTESNRTGSTQDGKVDNALPLLIHGIREVIGYGMSANVDVIFTCPDVKAYGNDIKKNIVGNHKVVTPADVVAGTDEILQTINICTVSAKAESFIVAGLLPKWVPGKEPKDAEGDQPAYAGTPLTDAVILDKGDRTDIVTVLRVRGNVPLRRRVFDSCGTTALSERLIEEGALVGMKGLARMPSTRSMTNFILNEENSSRVQRKISPQLHACSDPTVEYINAVAPGVPVFLAGGGANVPGLAEMFKPAATLIGDRENSQWVTVDGLLQRCDQLIEKQAVKDEADDLAKEASRKSKEDATAKKAIKEKAAIAPMEVSAVNISAQNVNISTGA